MKNMIRFLFVLCLHSSLFAGIGHIPCQVSCTVICTSAAAALTGGILAPAAALACTTSCALKCIAMGIMTGCFSEGTKVSVLEHGIEVEKNVELIQAGDLVRTLKSGKLIWTKVLKNTKIEGDFDFIQIDTVNATNHRAGRLAITPEHGMILMNEHGEKTLDSASHLQVGDHIMSSTGSLLSVTAVNAARFANKYTLETLEGTVIAADMLVSTICADEVAGGERQYDEKMTDWRGRHPWASNQNP